MQENKIHKMDLKGKTITFYSYKGGVGRSMALVNIACLLSKRKKKVLLIDWDLEAPGLHEFFGSSIKEEDKGVIDLFTDFKEFIKHEENNTDENYTSFLKNNINKYIVKNLKITDTELNLDIIKAGKFDDNYSSKCKNLDWMRLYKTAPAFFRTFAQFLEQKYDYILIDSRTGLSDTCGICTMLMPQVLVLVFVLNNQNIKGVTSVAKQSVDYRYGSSDYRNLTILPYPSRIDYQNELELKKWVAIYKKQFESLFNELYHLEKCNLENYFNIAKIPYKPAFAYGEKIAVLEESINNDFFISYHYNEFLKLILDSTPIWEILNSDQSKINEKKAQALLNDGIALYIDKNYQKACKIFEKASDFSSVSSALYNYWGASICELAKIYDDEILFYQSFEKFEYALEINPTSDVVYSNWGNSLSDLAKIKNDTELYEQSFEKFKAATKINSRNISAYYNWAIALCDLAELKSNEGLFNDSIEKYKIANKLHPNDDKIWYNWGIALWGLAELMKDTKLYNESFQKFKKAAAINPKNDSVYNNWGNAISSLAKLKNDENLYINSFEKYEQASKLSPKDADIYMNWGLAIFDYAKLKKSAEDLNEAIEKFKRVIDEGGESYNLSCVYAFKKDKSNALNLLELSLAKNEIKSSLVIVDEDWKAFWNDRQFKALINKYKLK